MFFKVLHSFMQGAFVQFLGSCVFQNFVKIFSKKTSTQIKPIQNINLGEVNNKIINAIIPTYYDKGSFFNIYFFTLINVHFSGYATIIVTRIGVVCTWRKACTNVCVSLSMCDSKPMEMIRNTTVRKTIDGREYFTFFNIFYVLK